MSHKGLGFLLRVTNVVSRSGWKIPIRSSGVHVDVHGDARNGRRMRLSHRRETCLLDTTDAAAEEEMVDICERLVP